jgi:hypothetical protein
MYGIWCLWWLNLILLCSLKISLFWTWEYLQENMGYLFFSFFLFLFLLYFGHLSIFSFCIATWFFYIQNIWERLYKGIWSIYFKAVLWVWNIFGVSSLCRRITFLVEEVWNGWNIYGRILILKVWQTSHKAYNKVWLNSMKYK